MRELKLSDESIIKYKESLNEAEYITLIEVAMDAYQYGIGDNFDNLNFMNYNPIKAEQAFNRTLLSICIADYNSDDYDKYFTDGVHTALRLEVKNASDAWYMIESLIHSSLDVSVVVDNFLGKVLDVLENKLPNGEDMIKVLKKLPKEWTKVFNEFQEITGVQEKSIIEEPVVNK